MNGGELARVSLDDHCAKPPTAPDHGSHGVYLGDHLRLQRKVRGTQRNALGGAAREGVRAELGLAVVDGRLIDEHPVLTGSFLG